MFKNRHIRTLLHFGVTVVALLTVPVVDGYSVVMLGILDVVIEVAVGVLDVVIGAAVVLTGFSVVAMAVVAITSKQIKVWSKHI
jgi:hypothetical protein